MAPGGASGKPVCCEGWAYWPRCNRRALSAAVSEAGENDSACGRLLSLVASTLPLVSSHSTRCNSRPLRNICCSRSCTFSADRELLAMSTPRLNRLSSLRASWKRMVCSTHSVSAISCSWRSLLSIWRACQGSQNRIDRNSSSRMTGSSQRIGLDSLKRRARVGGVGMAGRVAAYREPAIVVNHNSRSSFFGTILK
ncbi:hypothetical protein D3C85_737460 [compost metagenome]